MAIKAQASQTLVDLTDGFSVSLSQDSAAWNGNLTNLGTQQQVSVTVSAYQGASSASAFTIGTCTRSDATNCTASVSGSTVTITVKAAATTGGTVTIPVNITSNGSTITINKTFSYSIALKGATGTSVTVSSVGYQSGTSATTAPTGSWSSSPVTVADGNYLWTKTTYSDGSYAYSVAKQGVQGNAGSSVTVTSIEYAYQLSTSGTTVPTGSWSSTPVAPTTTQYAWTRTTTTYSDSTTAVTYTVGGKTGQQGVQGPQGEQGDQGDPAIVLAVTADTTVLKNNSGSSTLTANVYVGGNEATINATTGVVTYDGATIGTVKWYEGSSTTGTAGKTHQVSASSITNTLTVYAKLEG